MSILGAITGSDSAAKKSGKAIKKAEKKNQAIIRNEQLPASKDLYAEQKGISNDAAAKQTAAINAASGNQQNALAQASAKQQQALQQGLQQQVGAYQPYAQYGQGGIGLMQGGFGEDPSQAAAFMQRFQNSPLYQATYQSALDNARNELERRGSAAGGLNSGGILRELADRSGQIGLNTIGDYYNMLNGRIGQGMQAAGGLAGAYGNNAANSASAYGNTGQLQSSAYGQQGSNLSNAYGQNAQNQLGSGQLYSNNLNNAYGALTNSNSAIGAGKAAAYMGAANTNAALFNGGANALGTAAGAFGGAQKPWFL